MPDTLLFKSVLSFFVSFKAKHDALCMCKKLDIDGI